MENEEENKLAVTFGTAFLAAAAGTYLPGAEVAIAPAFVLIDAWLQKVVGSVAERQRRSVVSAIAAAGDESGLDPVALLRAIEGDERLLVAFGEVVTAAQKTEWEAKIRSLGRVLGKMAKDSALIDPQLVWLEILKQVDRPHMRVLQTAVELQRWHHGNGTDARMYIRTASGLGTVARPLVSTLDSLGLMEGETGPGELADAFYELLEVEMPSWTPPRIEPDDSPIAIEQSDPDRLQFTIRVERPEAFTPTMLWVAAVFRERDSYSSADLTFSGGEEVFLVDLEQKFKGQLEDGMMIENFVVVWFMEGTRYQHWWKSEPRISYPDWR